MKIRAAHLWLVAVLGLVPLSWASSDLTLPEWTLRMQPDKPDHLGGLLWPRAGNGGLNVDPKTGAPRSVVPGEAGEYLADFPELNQPNVEIGSFLLPSPKSRSLTKPASAPTHPDQLRDLPADLVTKCYQSTAGQFILDPGYQLSEHERDDFERFLSYHARDSRIQAHVIFLAKDERLPASMSLARIAGGSLLKDNTCLLVLPVGEADRARMFFTNSIHKATPAATLADILSECINESRVEAESVEQVHRMLVKLSIRLFWLQNHLEPLRPAEKASPEPSPLPTRPMPEVKLTEVQEPSLPWSGQPLLRLNRWGVLVGILVLMTCGLWVAFRWHRYRLRTCEWVLPQLEEANIPQRLGGRYCGASGAALTYR